MQQLVIKFGGTSVSSLATWENIYQITQQHIKTGVQPIIVCSALSQASNKLEKAIEHALLNQHQAIEAEIAAGYHDLAKQLKVSPELITNELNQLRQWLTGIALLGEASPKTRAQIMSLGELMMTRLGHAFLNNKGLNCLWFDVRDALKSHPIPGGDLANYLQARCDSLPNSELSQQLVASGSQAVITQGFFAANDQGETVILGRGGSDTSAALLAGILEAQACEIWTDVPGIYTANPHQLPHARLLKQLNYDEAQEIASMGAKVLHPNCIPPVRRAKIPMMVKYTAMPNHSGTRISQDSDGDAPPIKSIQVKHGIILVSIDTLNMWQQVGFLADVFATFKQHGFSVDLLSSSEFNVTVSLDSSVKQCNRQALDALLIDLNRFSRSKLIEPCSAVSLVGHRLRTVLPQLGAMLELFHALEIHLMSLASNDLNLTFVVDESQANSIYQKLHELLIENNPQSFYYSKSWHEEFGQSSIEAQPWWKKARMQLLDVGKDKAPCYVYHLPTIQEKADALKGLASIDKLFYAIKANPHPEILRVLYERGLNFECVSINELEHVLHLFPKISRDRLLFTPNFAAKKEYEQALTLGCYLTIDNLYPLTHWPELFRNQKVIIRIDPGQGSGHHKYVRTGGDESKFGISQADLPALIDQVTQENIKVIGLHTHSGSGILTPDLWQKTALMLCELASRFPEVKIINIGGGLGIVEKPNQSPLDLKALDASLALIKANHSHLQFWMEPGRYFVAEAGVILSKVTQTKEKAAVQFIGIDTGMNSLMRPALYGAYHDIVNLTRLDEENTCFANVVGPICESGDTLGYNRLLPPATEQDLILIANTGAYGHCMSSNYNLRPPAQELVLE